MEIFFERLTRYFKLKNMRLSEIKVKTGIISSNRKDVVNRVSPWDLTVVFSVVHFVRSDIDHTLLVELRLTISSVPVARAQAYFILYCFSFKMKVP